MNAMPRLRQLAHGAIQLRLREAGTDNFQTCHFSQTTNASGLTFNENFLHISSMTGSLESKSQSKSKSNTRVASSTLTLTSTSSLWFVVWCNTIVISCPAETLQVVRLLSCVGEESRDGTKHR